MKDDTTHMHFVGKTISPNQFIAEHTFVYVVKGLMHVYDGKRHVVLQAGDCCIARKNRLARYNKELVDNELEKVFVFFDEAFLRRFEAEHSRAAVPFDRGDTLVQVAPNPLLPLYIRSLMPYYDRAVIDPVFTDVKRTELLLILLRVQPDLAGLFFDYGIPGKLNIEAFMNHHFRFNVPVERFAFLTGRSLSAFKRDFQDTFQETPARWLVRKRLEEAYFLIARQRQKPADIYLELGFESLSHFSFAFKKAFGVSPSSLLK